MATGSTREVWPRTDGAWSCTVLPKSADQGKTRQSSAIVAAIRARCGRLWGYFIELEPRIVAGRCVGMDIDRCNYLISHLLKVISTIIIISSKARSQSLCQDSTLIQKISKVLTSKVLKYLDDQSKDNAKGYGEFYNDYSRFLREGLYYDLTNTVRWVTICYVVLNSRTKYIVKEIVDRWWNVFTCDQTNLSHTTYWC